MSNSIRSTELDEGLWVVETHATTAEQAELLHYFIEMLNSVSKDGGKKRKAGLKPSWKIDTSHEAALFSHLNKWKHGEKQDKDSGAHPLVHLAWRALAIAFQESSTFSYAKPEVPVQVASGDPKYLGRDRLLADVNLGLKGLAAYTASLDYPLDRDSVDAATREK